MFLFHYVCSGQFNAIYQTLVLSAVTTLSDSDLAELLQATLEMQSWHQRTHAHPGIDASFFCNLGLLITDLRCTTLTAGFSCQAHQTVMDQLGGRSPLHAWGNLRLVSMMQTPVVLAPSWQMVVNVPCSALRKYTAIHPAATINPNVSSWLL
jgi:hypothetical protein